MATSGRMLLVAIMVMGLGLAGSAEGKDRDHDETPAQETGCNALLDGTHNSLYGNCVAFCEAQDCDQQQEYSNSCQRLLRNFTRKADGVVMPCLQRLLPADAVVISEKKFDSLASDDGLIPLADDDVEVQNAREQAEMEDDIATIQDFNDRTGSTIAIPVEPDDPTVTKLSDDSYLHTITLKDGTPTQVVTLGRRWMISRIADSIRGFGTFQNQLAMYETSYGIIRDNGYHGLDDVLVDPQLIREHPDEFSAERLMALNQDIADSARDIIPILPVIPGLRTPGDCSNDIGNGTGMDRGHGAYPDSPECTMDPQGIYLNESWAGKYDNTCVKDQWKRGSCVAFAVTAATEYEIKKRKGVSVNLSEQALYNQMKLIWERMDYGDGFTNTKAWKDSIANGYLQPFEFQWNYNPSPNRTEDTVGDKVVGYHDSCVGYSETCSDTTHQSAVFCFFFPTKPAVQCGYLSPPINPDHYGYRLKTAWQLWNPDTKSSLQSLNLALLYLAAGDPILIGIPVTPSFDAAGHRSGAESGIVDYLGYEDPVTFGGGHALLAVGYVFNEDLPPGVPDGDGGGYVIVKNSWSSCWGDGGYVYLPFEYFRMYVGGADVITDVY